MVRYLAGEVRLPAADVDRILTAWSAYLADHAATEGEEIDLSHVVHRIVEQTMLPRGQVERTLTAMLDLGARLDAALGEEPPAPGAGGPGGVV